MTELKYTEMRLTFGWANKRLLLIGVVAVIFVIFLGYFITSLSSVTPDEEVSSVLDTEKTSKSEEKDPEPPVEKSEAETTTEITEVKTTKEMAQMAVETKTVPSGATGLLFKGEIVRQFPSKDRKFLTYKPKKLHREQSNLCEKFGVVTTIFNMSTAVKRFLQMSDWCLVVVGDKKEPKNYFGQIQHFSSSRVYHLTAQLQLKMGWDLADLLPWNDVARKNVGYAYAISLGAKYIWDFDDDNQLNFFLPQSAPLGGPSLDNFVNSAKLSSNASLSVVEITNVKCLAFNIFDHILNESDKNYWPRGYPLDLINNRTCSQGEREKVKLQSDQLAAVQSLADKELDYDAIFRLTRKFKFWLNLRGENQLLIIPKTTFVPYNGQSILQLYPGFWSLYLPFTVNGRVSDIWRSYAAQRLFREANLRWGYFSRPIVVQDRNSHRYLAGLNDSNHFYPES